MLSKSSNKQSAIKCIKYIVTNVDIYLFTNIMIFRFIQGSYSCGKPWILHYLSFSCVGKTDLTACWFYWQCIIVFRNSNHTVVVFACAFSKLLFKFKAYIWSSFKQTPATSCQLSVFKRNTDCAARQRKVCVVNCQTL